jgi:hypothetical protein
MAHTDSGSHDESDNKKKRRIPIGSADGWTAIATIFLVLVGAWGIYEGKNALELAQRAWIVPIGAQLLLKVEPNRGIRLGVNIINPGREPAIDVNVRIQNHVIDKYAARVTDMTNVTVPANTACDNLEPIVGRSIIGPSQPGGAFQWNVDSQHGEPSLLGDENIATGNKFYVVEGCFAYMTYQKRHTSSFCYVMEFDDATLSLTPNSFVPQNVVLPPDLVLPADRVTSVQAHVFAFNPCSTGFEAH